MEFALVLLKAFGVVFGLGGGGMLLSVVIMILWVKHSSRGKLYIFFFEKSREISGELISLGVNDNPERFRSIGGGEYVIDSRKTFWYFWPAGFPRFVQQPIPALAYERNDPNPIDPSGQADPSVTAMSIQYMMDEAFLRTTWRDAKDAIEDTKPTGKTNLSLYISIGTVALMVVMVYFGWSMYNTLTELRVAILGAP